MPRGERNEYQPKRIYICVYDTRQIQMPMRVPDLTWKGIKLFIQFIVIYRHIRSQFYSSAGILCMCICVLVIESESVPFVISRIICIFRIYLSDATVNALN